MSRGPSTIVVDCERMKYPHTGLYQFCLHLSQALLQTNVDKRLCFYTPSRVKNIFGKEACYLRQRPAHKLIFPSTKDVSLWHCTHQSSDYFPFNKNVKKLLTLHDLNYLHDETKPLSKKQKFTEGLQQKVDAADAVVAISQFALNDAQQYLDLKNKPCRVIYNGCTINELTELRPPSFVPQRPYLFTIGAINGKKNFAVLPRLLPHNDFGLVIAGLTQNEVYKQKIEEEATRLGVSSRLHFTGAINEADKQWYLKHCAAFVFPSLAEGFGLPVLEAMYFGRPVLLSSATSLPEIGGEVACYFNGFGEDEMQQALQDCLHRYETEAELKTALQQRARSFSWQEAALQYHQVYDELLREG